MAVRCLDPSKVLLTGQNRVRITGNSVLDVIAYDGGKNTPGFQVGFFLSGFFHHQGWGANTPAL